MQVNRAGMLTAGRSRIQIFCRFDQRYVAARTLSKSGRRSRPEISRIHGKHLFRILKIAERRVRQLDRLQVERVSIGLAGLSSLACARIGQMRIGCGVGF
jgi:hypothetical protein